MYEFTSCFYVFMCQWDPHISQIVFPGVATVSINIQRYHLPLSKRALSWWKQRRCGIWGGKKKRKLGNAVVIFTGNCSFLLRVCRAVPFNQVKPKPQFVVRSIQVSPNHAFSLILTKLCLCQNPTKP